LNGFPEKINMNSDIENYELVYNPDIENYELVYIWVISGRGGVGWSPGGEIEGSHR
jgi:hypothetical protein